MRFRELKIHLPLPAKSIHQGPDHEGSEEASEGEHGHGKRPQPCQGELAQVLMGSRRVGLIIKILHELQNRAK